MWSLTGAKAEQNPDVGLRWLREAARDGLPIAQSSLGLLYASGVVVEKDERKAAGLYRKAAEYGDPLGQTALGLASFLGVGVGAETASWGRMINQGRFELSREPVIWWNLVAAMLFMFGLLLPANIFGDAVRDALDPRLARND